MWSYEPARVKIRRPDPNFGITWALALSAPIQTALAIWILLTTEPPVWFLLALLGAGANWLLASLDVRRVEALPDRVRTDPALAAASPLLYLLVRLLRDSDPRAGRPFWTAVAVTPPALFFLAVAVIGAYAARTHGY